MDSKVNLLVIGAGRSGTTSLCYYLKNHPEICFSDIKEVHYFTIEDLLNRGENYLHSYFQYAGEKITGTADTYLLIDTKAPKRVYKYNPNCKIIVMLREPVARAYSSYHYAINNGYQSKEESFLESIQLEKERLLTSDIIQKNNLCHIAGSLYFEYLSHWTKFFPKENFLLIKTEDLSKDYKEVLNRVSSFLDIKAFDAPEEIYINKASPVKSKGLQQFLLNRNHPVRNIIRPIIKPFKYLINKSGLIDSIYKINKTEKKYTTLLVEEKEYTQKLFSTELSKIEKEFGVVWPG